MGEYGYDARIYSYRNSSPQFIPSPIWYIDEGCGGKTYHINPVDPEGNTIRCRWSTASEAGDMAWHAGLKQFSLNEENCIVTYHPEFDFHKEGSKPIAVQVEDFYKNEILR